jgi:Ser/Thr protein kinase RdoA (MazF antagonist)
VLPDGGTPLAEAARGAELIDAFEAALAQYGQLQRDLAPHVDSLLELGVSDMRAAIMPARFDEALEAVARYAERSGDEADRATYRRVAGLRDDFVAWCDQLLSAPGASSLDHNDLHTWNVFMDAGAGNARFYDWGDCVVAHPFASMLVALGFVQLNVLEVGVDDPQVLRLRDAYLEPFSDLAPHTELVEALELACRVGKAARALTWTRALSELPPEDVDDQWTGAPLESMASLLDDSYLGGA